MSELTREEKLLKEAVGLAMDMDLAEYPAEEEITNSHKFTDIYDKQIRNIIKKKSGFGRFAYRYGKAAAALVVLGLLAAVVYNAGRLQPKDSGDFAAEDAAPLEQDFRMEAAEESAMDDAADNDEAEIESALIEEAAVIGPVSFTGWSFIEDAFRLHFTLQNNSGEVLEGPAVYSLEMQTDEGWQEIAFTEEESLPDVVRPDEALTVNIQVDETVLQAETNFRLWFEINGELQETSFTLYIEE